MPETFASAAVSFTLKPTRRVPCANQSRGNFKQTYMRQRLVCSPHDQNRAVGFDLYPKWQRPLLWFSELLNMTLARDCASVIREERRSACNLYCSDQIHRIATFCKRESSWCGRLKHRSLLHAQALGCIQGTIYQNNRLSEPVTAITLELVILGKLTKNITLNRISFRTLRKIPRSIMNCCGLIIFQKI